MYLQVLDTNVFSVFKDHYYNVAEEWLEQNGPRSKVKLSSSQSRVLCTRLTKSAWFRTLSSIDFKSAFKEIGYIWYDNSPIYSRVLAGFCFDPQASNSYLQQNDDDNDRIDREAKAAKETTDSRIYTNNQTKQTTLKQFWK